MYDDVLIPGDMDLFHSPSYPTNFYGGNIRGHLSADSPPMEIVYCVITARESHLIQYFFQ